MSTQEKFSELITFKDLELWLDDKAYRHNKYCHYTSLEAANNILKGNAIWVSNVNGFNDEKDKAQFSNPELCFSLCFSSGDNENLSLWYLYSGMNGKGVRLRLTTAVFRDLIKKSDYYLINTATHAERKLYEGIDFDRKVHDIVYYRNNQAGLTDLKYNNNVNHNMPNSEFELYKNGYNGFYKGLIWYYEKEVRILIKLNENFIDTIDDWKNFKVELRFPKEFRKKIKIDFAPEFENWEDIAKIDTYKPLKEFIFETSNVGYSEHKGEVKMRLCSKCRHKLKGKKYRLKRNK